MSEFFASHAELLRREYEFEVAETEELTTKVPPKVLERHGLALTSLVVSNVRTGMAGRSLADLGVDPMLVSSPETRLPTHSFQAGDVALLRPLKVSVASSVSPESRVEVTIARVHETYLTVSIDCNTDESVQQFEGRFWLVPLPNYKTYKRLFKTVADLQKDHEKLSLIHI